MNTDEIADGTRLLAHMGQEDAQARLLQSIARFSRNLAEARLALHIPTSARAAIVRGTAGPDGRLAMTGAAAGALVLFSGGQDSTTCLALALDRYAWVETIGFDYGQRHRIELDQRATIRESLRQNFPAWRERLGEDHLIRIEALAQISTTAMTHDVEIATDARGLPNTFVPGRNLMFLSLAAALAYRRGFKHIVGGMCETDFSGYPDCRDDTVKAMQLAVNLGMDSRFILETPLMWLDKAATWRLAETLGGTALVALIVESTHSCYLGERAIRHDWGHGCGSCPACRLRDEGWRRYIASSENHGPA